MRVEDRWQAYRERRARRRGYVATVMPFTGYGTAGWIRVLGRVVMARPAPSTTAGCPPSWWPTASAAGGTSSARRWPTRAVTISAAGVEHHVVADRGGVVDAKVSVELAPGWHTVTLRCEDSEPVEAAVYVVPPGERFGVVSDVDDTVMVTALPRPLLAAWNTFVLDEHARNPTPGMAVMLERVTREHPGSPVLYLSTGAWNVAQTLTRFLSRNLYPDGALLLTDWGPTKDRWFRSGQGHKVGPAAAAGRRVPGHQVAADRRRRTARRSHLRGLRAALSGARGGHRHPATVGQRSGAGRRPFTGAPQRTGAQHPLDLCPRWEGPGEPAPAAGNPVAPESRRQSQQNRRPVHCEAGAGVVSSIEYSTGGLPRAGKAAC